MDPVDPLGHWIVWTDLSFKDANPESTISARGSNDPTIRNELADKNSEFPKLFEVYFEMMRGSNMCNEHQPPAGIHDKAAKSSVKPMFLQFLRTWPISHISFIYSFIIIESFISWHPWYPLTLLTPIQGPHLHKVVHRHHWTSDQGRNARNARDARNARSATGATVHLTKDQGRQGFIKRV